VAAFSCGGLALLVFLDIARDLGVRDFATATDVDITKFSVAPHLANGRRVDA